SRKSALRQRIRQARELLSRHAWPISWPGEESLEVTPAVAGKLRSVAGEWAGFDEAWLLARIAARQRKESFWNRRVPPGPRRMGADPPPHRLDPKAGLRWRPQSS